MKSKPRKGPSHPSKQRKRNDRTARESAPVLRDVQDGNIFGIMGRASRLLKQAGMKEQSDEMISRVTACGDYNMALNIISEYVETELSPRPEPQKSQKKKGRNAHTPPTRR